MKEYKFSKTFDPSEQDEDFPKYRKHLYQLFLILDPLILNRIVDDEESLSEIHSALGCFAMYIYKEGLKGRINN